MRIEMKIFNPTTLDTIKSGRKTVELRLNDEKRSLLKLDDEIEFIYNDSAKCVVRIIGLCHFKNFTELFKQIDPIAAGFEKADTLDYCSQWMTSVYSVADIEKYGALGIVIEPI